MNFQEITLEAARRRSKVLLKQKLPAYIYEVRMYNLKNPIYLVISNKNTFEFEKDKIYILIEEHYPIIKRTIEVLTNKIVSSIKNYFIESQGQKAIIGISDGKDSAVTAALCVKALGKENVIGILIPDSDQSDIDNGKKLCEFLGIQNIEINIATAYYSIINQLINNNYRPSNQAITNLAPRIRMATLYTIAQSVNGRVINTTNACERFVGYGTLYGDLVGDYAPLKNVIVSDVYKIGDHLKLPNELVHKISFNKEFEKTDEEILGVSYEDIGKYVKIKIKNPNAVYADMKEELDLQTYNKINELISKNKFKSELINIPGADLYYQ